MASLHVAARLPATCAEGPGVRFAIWLQGCSIRCLGCCNPHLFESAGGEVMAVEQLLVEIGGASSVEGVTVLGGEPLDQPEGLAALARGVRARGLSTVVFTGFTLLELRASTNPSVADVLASIDVLVDGRYDAATPETERLWVGSRNQRFHYLSDRYTEAIERPKPGGPHETVEVRIRPDGSVVANGWPLLRPHVLARE
jgi:anaerobic ribonucleoside-triphosphate reductase activating protein